MDPDTRLGPYEIKEPLGKGGMGEVYRARDGTLRRDVAIKLLPEDMADDPERLARLKREARALATLNHPHIATVHGFEEHDGTAFIVMELVEGETLAERLREGALGVEEALAIGAQIAEALEAAHERGIVHRDLKPANVKITPAGRAVEPRTNAEVYKERPGFSTSSMNLTAFLEKRFADGWLAKASFSWSDPSVNYDDPLSFTDPTNIPFQDGRPGHDRLSATWMVKGSGMYQLPAGFSVAGFFQVREGYIFNPTVLVPSRPNGGGSIQVLTVPKGEDRLPTFWNLDLRVEKTLDILDRGRLHLILDGFNLPNNDIVLGRSSTLNTSVFNRITEVVQGRTIRFGVRLVLR